MFKTIARWFGYSHGPVERPEPWPEPQGPRAYIGPDAVKTKITNPMQRVHPTPPPPRPTGKAQGGLVSHLEISVIGSDGSAPIMDPATLDLISRGMKSRQEFKEELTSERTRAMGSEVRANFERDEAYKDRDLWYKKAVAAEDRLIDQRACLQNTLEENQSLKGFITSVCEALGAQVGDAPVQVIKQLRGQHTEAGRLLRETKADLAWSNAALANANKERDGVLAENDGLKARLAAIDAAKAGEPPIPRRVDFPWATINPFPVIEALEAWGRQGWDAAAALRVIALEVVRLHDKGALSPWAKDSAAIEALRAAAAPGKQVPHA